MQKFASALQRVTVVGDEMIVCGMSQIAMLGKLSGEGLKRATVAALDLSAAIGIDFQTASMLMARAASGNTSSLSRYGLAIETTGDKQKDFENLLKMTETRMGGAASIATDSFTGKVTQLKNAWGDAVEQLGKGANESERLQEIIIKLTDFIQEHQEEIVRFGEVIADFAADAIEFMMEKFLNMRRIIGEFLLSISKIADKIAELSEKMGQEVHAENFRRLSAASAQLSIQLFKGQHAIDAHREALDENRQAIKDEEAEMLKLAGFVDATGEQMEGLADATTEATAETVTALEEFVPEVEQAGQGIGTALGMGIEEAYMNQEPLILDAVEQTIDGINTTLEGLTTQVETTRTSLIAGIAKTFGAVVGIGAARTAQEYAAATQAIAGFQEGGIVTKPTLAMVGEGGEPELIAPLSKLGGLGGKRIINNFDIKFTGPFMGVPSEARLFARQMIRYINEENARG
jgi:hypothetical protein